MMSLLVALDGSVQGKFAWAGLIGVGLNTMGASSAAGAGADGGSGDMDEEAKVGCIAKAPAEAAKSFPVRRPPPAAPAADNEAALGKWPSAGGCAAMCGGATICDRVFARSLRVSARSNICECDGGSSICEVSRRSGTASSPEGARSTTPAAA